MCVLVRVYESYATNLGISAMDRSDGSVNLNPFIAKTATLFWPYIHNKVIFWKIFEGEMLIRTRQKSPYQIFYCYMYHYEVISIIAIVPDENYFPMGDMYGWIYRG